MIQQLNDLVNARNVRFTTLSIANTAAALASGVFAIVAIANPSALVASPVAPNPATVFYVDMYALRALSIAAGLIAASLTVRRVPLVGAVVLAAGGLVQLGDVAVAAHFATPGVVGASVAAVVHLASAVLLVRFVRASR